MFYKRCWEMTCSKNISRINVEKYLKNPSQSVYCLYNCRLNASIFIKNRLLEKDFERIMAVGSSGKFTEHLRQEFRWTGHFAAGYWKRKASGLSWKREWFFQAINNFLKKKVSSKHINLTKQVAHICFPNKYSHPVSFIFLIACINGVLFKTSG